VKKKYKAVCVGAGYFSHFHYEAWSRIPEVEIAAICDLDNEKSSDVQNKFAIPNRYTDYRQMIEKEKPDFIDIITPPETHLEICQFASDLATNVICQKPLAPTLEESRQIVKHINEKGIRFMVHENWRFQPWYREIKNLLTKKIIGDVHTVNFRSRMGDGWGENAYKPRQPYFRKYPRLLIYENGIHFIDTFRYLFGEVSTVYARLRKLNPIIKGEDWAIIHFGFEQDVFVVWDANRYNEPNYERPRYTFGEMLIEGVEGSIRLYFDGRLTIQLLGQMEREHVYQHDQVQFAGDCVYFTQRHFIDCLNKGTEFETNGEDYLKSIAVQEAVYESNGLNKIVRI
jgi:predicted dehydrogenase